MRYGLLPLFALLASPSLWGASNQGTLPLALPDSRGLPYHHLVDVNAQDDQGQTQLLRAVKDGHAKQVVQLLDVSGVDVNCSDSQGYTPLMWACAQGDTAILALLLRNPLMDIEYTNAAGEDAMKLATQHADANLGQEMAQKLKLTLRQHHILLAMGGTSPS